MSFFLDTGPEPDGRRTEAQWIAAAIEDEAIINGKLAEVASGESPDVPRDLALARKEARRLVRDIERYAEEVYGLSGQELDRQGPL